MKFVRFCLLPLIPLLASCRAVVLDPAGDIAARQRDLLIESTLLMLLIIVPVMTLTAIFAWRYRQSNATARYEPDWDHSTKLELIIWAGPLLIIICLGALTWVGTHLLDPYRNLSRLAPGRAVSAAQPPLRVDVVALDWKWLFIYPEYGVASVNDLAVPVDRPVDFHITSSAVMNSFYVPALAGMIYAMPGMETRLHAVANRSGDYQGISANYSGAGFSGMHFGFHVLADAGFDGWIATVRQSTQTGTLDRAAYLKLEQPSENEPVRYFASVENGLFRAALERCVEAGKMCSSQMMAVDARGGQGIGGLYNVARLDSDKSLRRGALPPAGRYVLSLCSPADPGYVAESAPREPIPDETPLLGRGLPQPGRAQPIEQAANWSPAPLRGASL